VQGAIIGFGGAGTANGAATRNSTLALVAALVGAYAGNRVGAQMRTLIATRRFQLHRNGQWIVTELPVPAQQPTPQPDPSAALSFPPEPRVGPAQRSITNYVNPKAGEMLSAAV
jgi:hypothetical protein